MRGDVTKLPKWAQQEIGRLERDLAAAHKKLAAGPDDSNTFAEAYGKAPRPLGDSPTIEFRYGDGWYEKIEAKLDGNELRVSGGTTIAVLPQASNVVRIAVTR